MKIGKLLIGAMLLVAAMPDIAVAQDETYFYGTPWIGTVFFAGDIGEEVSTSELRIEKASIANSPGYGLFAGVRFQGRFGIEGVFSYVPSTVAQQATISGTSLKIGYDLNVMIFGANLLYAFSTSKTSVVPYLTVGAGGMSFSPEQNTVEVQGASLESTTEFMFNFGGGLEIPISNAVDLRLDLRDYVTSTNGEFTLFPSEDSSTSLHTILFAGGVSFRTN